MEKNLPKPPLWLVNLTAFCVGTALVVSLVFVLAREAARERYEGQQTLLRTIPSPQNLIDNPFENIELEGKAAIVLDVTRRKVVFERNAEAQLPLASLTKLMTALITAETLPPYTAVEIQPRTEERDVQLKVGERWNLKELLAYTLLTSSNTGADSMAAAAAGYLEGKGTLSNPRIDLGSPFVDAMNQKAEKIGMRQTYFLNPSGLDANLDVSGSYGSAKDVATLLAYIVVQHPSLLEATEQTELVFTAPDGRKIKARNTNERAATIPGIMASKTGLTDLAGGNLAIAFDASFNEPFVIAVLGSSQEGRFIDTEKLVAATVTYLGSGLKSKPIR